MPLLEIGSESDNDIDKCVHICVRALNGKSLIDLLSHKQTWRARFQRNRK